MDINKTLEFYCNNEMAELKKICYPLFIKIGGISDKDYDDFYSIALEALSDSAIRYKDDKNCERVYNEIIKMLDGDKCGK